MDLFPSNRPTQALRAEETEPTGFCLLPHEKKAPQAKLSCGRWGEVEKEKGPVDLFPVEPTIEPHQGEETLDHGFKGLLALIKEES